MSNDSNMDWAAVAAQGANQSPEEARAPPVDTIIPNESASTSSLVDVDSGVSVVPSDFREQSVKTETQAARLELEAEAARAAEERERNEQNGSSKGSSSKKAQAKKQVRKTEEYARTHPVQFINGILGTVAAVALGLGAYRKYKVGELSWKVVGIWGGAAAAVAAVDILATRFYLKKQSNN